MDINEIARLAGVSRTTVSRYLNDGYVSQEKRKRIRRVIEETGYVPSRQARQLRTGKTSLVGVIIPKIHSQSVSRMVAGITAELEREGYQTVLATTENRPNREIRYLNLFSTRNHVDGIILIGTVFTPEHLDAIANLMLPFVVLGQHLEGYPCVYQDDYNAVRSLTKLMLRKATRVGYLGVLNEDFSAGHERKRGFLDACEEMRVPIEPDAIKICNFDADSGYFKAERLLEDVPDVDTIICASDRIAFGAMMCMREYGRDVPTDVQVAGVGDSMLSRIAYPSLTTVHLFYKTSGTEAARLLIGRMRGLVSDTVEEVKMSYEVYGRASMR